MEREDNFYERERQLETDSYAGLSIGRYTAKTFLIMFLGLLVTFGVAFFFSRTYAGVYLLWRAFQICGFLHVILLVAQLAVVIGMSAAIRTMSPAAATACFFVYSVLTGLTFTVYFIMYDWMSLILVFAATALYFGGMAVFGYLTHIDLSRMRVVLIGGLIFLIIMNLLMMFIPGLQVADRVVCTIGVVIFLAFTAYDTQKIKAFYYAFQGDEEMLKKASVISALELYLDFINMFLYLLRLFGKRKN